jgi:hypothetical protein
MLGPFGRNRRQFMGIVGVGTTASAQVLFPAVAAAAGVAAARRGGATSSPPGQPAGVFEVTRFGAVADGSTPSTAGLQRAIDACGEAGGGIVLVPAGRYLTGSLSLRSHMNLHLMAGATLLGSTRFDDYPPTMGRDEGIERTIHAALLMGRDLTDLAITGQGTIDHQGDGWWKADQATRQLRVDAKLPREAEHPPGAPLKWPRPRVINLVRCKQVDIEGLTLIDGACWNVHLVYCEDVNVQGLTIFQRREARGTDGVVVDSSKHVRISNCSISSGSDCIALKSGYNEDGRRVGLSCEDVVISNCHMPHSSASGVAIGSETTGSIRDVVVNNCVMNDCLSGMHVRSPRGRGGVVERIRVSNLVIDNVTEMAIKLSHFFDSIRMEGRYGLYPTAGRRNNPETARSRRVAVDQGTPCFQDFEFSGLMLGRMRDVALLEGLPERFIRGISFQDIVARQAKAGIYCSMVAEISISNLTVGSMETPAVDARDVERLEVHRLRCPTPSPAAPAVWLENVADAFVHGCYVGSGAPGYEWLRQQQSHTVTLADNSAPVKTPAAR